MAMKRPTLSDVALAVGVSRSAAARVLLGTGGDHVRVSPRTRERIEAAAQRLHYAPNRLAQQLRGVSSKTIGVILDSENIPVMSQRLFALEAAANQRGYRLIVGQTHGQTDTLQEYVGDFAGRGVEAILCLFDLAPGRDERAKMCFKTFRKIVFHGRPAWKGGYGVRVDTGEAIKSCVDHLMAQGKKRLAISLWNGANDELMEVRRTAFDEMLASHGRKGMVWDAAAAGNHPSVELLDRAIDGMIQRGRADAIIASNDIWATRFILQLQKIGLRIPEDVAVIGYDNLDIAQVVSPSLTTIDQCHDDYATAALDLLLKVAAGGRIALADRVRTIKPNLIIREST